MKACVPGSARSRFRRSLPCIRGFCSGCLAEGGLLVPAPTALCQFQYVPDLIQSQRFFQQQTRSAVTRPAYGALLEALCPQTNRYQLAKPKLPWMCNRHTFCRQVDEFSLHGCVAVVYLDGEAYFEAARTGWRTIAMRDWRTLGYHTHPVLGKPAHFSFKRVIASPLYADLLSRFGSDCTANADARFRKVPDDHDVISITDCHTCGKEHLTDPFTLTAFLHILLRNSFQPILQDQAHITPHCVSQEMCGFTYGVYLRTLSKGA